MTCSPTTTNSRFNGWEPLDTVSALKIEGGFFLERRDWFHMGERVLLKLIPFKKKKNLISIFQIEGIDIANQLYYYYHYCLLGGSLLTTWFNVCEPIFKIQTIYYIHQSLQSIFNEGAFSSTAHLKTIYSGIYVQKYLHILFFDIS